MASLLDVRNLKTQIQTPTGTLQVIDNLSFSIEKGETLALVGESGCGKSMTALCILGLITEPVKIVEGEILFEGENLLKLHPKELRSKRGRSISMIFQEPMSSLNPVLRIGDQIGEVLKLHEKDSAYKSRQRAIELLEQVGIPSPQQRIKEYPHQLSGGMRQRVMIAMALACNPKLLIADEPTTALDVTIQAQIMDLLGRLKKEREMSSLLITHDLGVVANSADRVAIMYMGQIVEYAPVKELFADPAHPYTRGLLDCIPRLGEKRKRLTPIEGQVPGAADRPEGCPFANRCPIATEHCKKEAPSIKKVSPNHTVRCWRA